MFIMFVSYGKWIAFFFLMQLVAPGLTFVHIVFVGLLALGIVLVSDYEKQHPE